MKKKPPFLSLYISFFWGKLEHVGSVKQIQYNLTN